MYNRKKKEEKKHVLNKTSPTPSISSLLTCRIAPILQPLSPFC